MAVTLINVEFNQRDIILTGDYNPKDISPSGIKIVQRSSTAFHSYPIYLLQGERWKVKLNFDLFLIANGKWDVYLIDESFKTIRIVPVENFKSPPVPLLFNKKMSKEILFYTTKYGNLSFNLKSLFVYLDNYSAYINQQSEIFLQAELSSNLIDITNHRSLALIINSKSGRQDTYKIDLTADTIIDKVNISTTFTEELLNLISTTNESKWNLDLLVEFGASTFKVRLILKDKMIKEKTSLLIEHGELKQAFLYSSLNNYLSLGFKKIKLNRRAYTCQFTETSILLGGYAYLDGTLFDEHDLSNRRLLIKSRDTDTILFEQTLPISNNLTNKGERYFHSEENTQFLINISIKDLIQDLETGHHVIDFWVSANYKSYKFIKKIGMDEFNYKKDLFFGSNKTTFKNRVSCNYLTTTPYGNIKLINYTHSKVNYFFIKNERMISELSKKKLWLIGERQDTAQDNGYHFFKYCRENYPELDIYYIINQSAEDYKNIVDLGNVVPFGSPKHYWLASKATTFIGTHDLEYILPTPGFELSSYRTANRVFLQHGVSGRKYVDYNNDFYNFPFDLFVVSSDEERNVIKKEYGYPLDKIIVTGLSRFDSLINGKSPRPSILIIPTWRDWISTEKQFVESDYFRRYYALLTNPRLKHILESNNLTVEFYVHYRMQKFIHHFKSAENDRIKIIKLTEVSVQDLIKRNKLMITDYSSVSFDFNYLSKPIIFYHFDFDRFFENGLMRPAKETFIGDIVTEEEDLIKQIEHYLHHQFKEKETFSDQKKSIFNIVDDNNNERIFKEIINLEKKNEVE